MCCLNRVFHEDTMETKQHEFYFSSTKSKSQVGVSALLPPSFFVNRAKDTPSPPALSSIWLASNSVSSMCPYAIHWKSTSLSSCETRTVPVLVLLEEPDGREHEKQLNASGGSTSKDKICIPETVDEFYSLLLI